MIQFYLAILTPCQPDGLLIKYPHFPEILNALIFNPIVYSYLQFDTVDYAPEPQTAEIACRQSSISSRNGISQNKTLCEAEQCRIYKCIQFHFASYLQHTLYTVLQDTSFFPPHHKQFFSSLCILKSPESLPGRSCLGPLVLFASPAIEGHQNWT